jgi:hypothetical protein
VELEAQEQLTQAVEAVEQEKELQDLAQVDLV